MSDHPPTQPARKPGKITIAAGSSGGKPAAPVPPPQKDGETPAPQPAARKPLTKRQLFLGLGAVALLILIIGGWKWLSDHRIQSAARNVLAPHQTAYQTARPTILLLQFRHGENRGEILEQMNDLTMTYGELEKKLPPGPSKQKAAAMAQSFRLLGRLLAMELSPTQFPPDQLGRRNEMEKEMVFCEKEAASPP
ncbi:MAG: hypothetical protein PHV34_15740 [Verrucomicrobiae bacterium]|nr:hypothetical protein [Verrucomicrobiae bacterium]